MRTALVTIATMVVGEVYSSGISAATVFLDGPGSQQIEIPDVVLRFP